ncbi:TetR family transcriptional regulator [Streptomyces sp. NPDC102360]|uniref:TetR family transcriptional regulator n=1 Tax=Streptomyces sp. NPDC102360 TaxID=3366160 RepID=UPI00380EB1CA
MPRRKNQAERRAHLVDAATAAILEHGATATKLRDVAAAAGVTPAAVLYYYPDLQAVFAAVLEHSRETFCELREAQIDAASNAVDQLRACIRSGVPWPGRAELSTRLLIELFPLTLRGEESERQQRTFAARQVTLYREVLQRGADDGVFTLAAPAEDLARSFLALEDGYAMDLMAGIETPQGVQARLLLHARIVTGSEALDAPAHDVVQRATASDAAVRRRQPQR